MHLQAGQHDAGQDFADAVSDGEIADSVHCSQIELIAGQSVFSGDKGNPRCGNCTTKGFQCKYGPRLTFLTKNAHTLDSNETRRAGGRSARTGYKVIQVNLYVGNNAKTLELCMLLTKLQFVNDRPRKKRLIDSEVASAERISSKVYVQSNKITSQMTTERRASCKDS
jgi:hypothetical protein